MLIPIETPLFLFANASSDVMRAYVVPVATTLTVLATVVCAFFLVNGGIQYMTSKGSPEKLAQAKRVVINALVGLGLVIAAATLTAILSNAYANSGTPATDKLPALQAIEQKEPDNAFVDAIIKGVIGLLRNIVQSVGEPFLNALGYFLNHTPLMAENSHVFNLWLAVVGITDVLFILVVGLIGFQVMSFASLGFEEIEIRQLLPQLALIFLLVNTSIFMIDGIIGLSNAMIYALQSGFPSTDVWATLANITKQSTDLGLVGLLVMVAFLILAVMLLIYYVGRLITLYIGAILSPLVLLLWLLPAFKDFAITAFKTYLTTIFVLFVHVVILLLAASIFTGMLRGDTNGQPDALMALIVGLATVVALLKTQGFMQELSYAASTPRAAREVTGSFMRGVSYMSKTVSLPRRGAKKAAELNGGIKKMRAAAQRKVHVHRERQKPENQHQAMSYNRNPSIQPPKTGETRRSDITVKREKEK